MTILRNVLIIALALLLQSTVFGRIHFLNIRPDFGMLALMYIVGNASTAECTLYGFLIGFLQDVYTPEYLGYNAFTMSILGFLLGILKETMTVEHYGLKTLATFAACLLHDLIYLGFYTGLDFSFYTRLFIIGSLAGALYTAALAFIFIAVYEWSVGGGLRIAVRGLIGFRR
jgi:rod shape-determining protein MreD